MSTTTIAPSFQLTLRSPERDLEQLARPVPSEVMPITGKLGEQHEKLAKRLGETRAKLLALDVRLRDVETTDAEAAREAIRRGRPIPESSREALLAEREPIVRELAALDVEIRTSAAALLVEIAPQATSEADRLTADADVAEQTVLDHLRAALQALDHSAEIRQAAGWCVSVVDGSPRPFVARAAHGIAAEAIKRAMIVVSEEAGKRERRLSETDHEERALQMIRGNSKVLPPPPNHEEARRIYDLRAGRDPDAEVDVEVDVDEASA